MSDFLDKVKGKIDEGISAVGLKTREAVELARLRSQLRQLEKEKEETIKRLGTFVYDMLRRGEYNEQKIRDFYPQVNNVDRQIVGVENEIKKIQEMSASEGGNIAATCECGAGLAANQKFCASCGKDVQEIIVHSIRPAENMKPCSTCGTEIKETANFCGKCGAKQ